MGLSFSPLSAFSISCTIPIPFKTFFDDSVEGASFVVSRDSGVGVARLAGAKRAKVFRRFGDGVRKEFEEDSAEPTSAHRDVEPDARVGGRHGWLICCANTLV